MQAAKHEIILEAIKEKSERGAKSDRTKDHSAACQLHVCADKQNCRSGRFTEKRYEAFFEH